MSTARRSRSSPPAAEPAAPAVAMRVLKKYPNRRLYDTQSSSYITLADVKQMVLDSEAFEVRDAKSGDDLTRSILLQIILEEESAGVPMFSTQSLAQIIRFYGHAMQGVMGSYLEQNLQASPTCRRASPSSPRACTTRRTSRPRCGPSSSAARRR